MEPENESLGYRSPIEALVENDKSQSRDEREISTLQDVLEILKEERAKLSSFDVFKAVGNPDLQATILGHQKADEILGNAYTRIEVAVARVTDKENE